MTMQAVRTVSETDDVHVIEGLLAYDGPFGGRDSYGTYFSARTAWGLDLHPQGIPVLYNHGFDNDIGLTPLGFTAPPASFRADDDGLWVQMQLDKREKYYATRVRPLLEQNALGISQGSAEHSVRIDERTGEVLAWPLHEVSLTPTESNPFNVVAARSGDDDVIRIIEAIRATDKSGKPTGPPEGGKAREDIPAEDFAGPDKSFPIVNQASVDDAASLVGKAADPDAVKAKVAAIAKRKGLKLPDAWQADAERSDWKRSDARLGGLVARDEAVRGSPSGDAAVAAGITQQLLFLRDCEMGEDDQVANIDTAINAVQAFLTQEMAEPAPPAYMSGVRQGKEISSKNQTRIDAIHQHAAAIMAHTGALGASTPDDDTEPAEEPDAASRSADSPTVTITQRDDVAAVRARLLQTAAQVGEQTAKAMLD